MISVKFFNGEYRAELYSKGFKTMPFTKEILKTHCITTAVLKDGHRITGSFDYATYGGIDVDHATYNDIPWALEKFKDYAFILGTTKSHRKNGNGDRYRIFFKWHKPITDAKTYNWNITKIIKECGSDQACKDAVRFFFPCIDIIKWQRSGKCFEWEIPPPEEKIEYKDEYKIYREHGVVPLHVMRMLQYLPREGKRNVACFNAALSLFNLGWDLTKVEYIIFNSVISKCGLSSEEIKRAIAQAHKYK